MQDEDWEALRREKNAWAFAGPLAGFLLIIGAFAPFGFWPPFRDALFGPLVDALMPLTTLVPLVSDAFWSLNPFIMVYIALTSAVAAGAARFAFGGRRAGAVVAGAFALIASGRVITGVAVLVVLTLAWEQFKARSGPRADEADAKESPAPAH